MPTENAHVVDQVLGAGAVSLGKLNMHEFASGGTSINHYTGSPRNPWAPDHITGGIHISKVYNQPAGLRLYQISVAYAAYLDIFKKYFQEKEITYNNTPQQI